MFFHLQLYGSYILHLSWEAEGLEPFFELLSSIQPYLFFENLTFSNSII